MQYLNKRLSFFKIPITFLLMIPALYGFAQVKNDSIKIAIEPEYDKVSKTHRFLLGENYRVLWATPVTLKIFRLQQEKGGLKILQLGGGMQTKSLRLEDPTGQEWVLRTIQKYPEKVLPANLRTTIAKDIVQDQISAEHPYASLTVPLMAQALGIPHAHPQIVYVPDDPALGQYRKDFANQVFLFEEREPLDASKTDNTGKAQDKLLNDNDNRVDQKLVLRARLLDMVLGDWDRHEDQWRWARDKNDTGIVYKPVPRDRDQVYNSSGGALPWLVSRYLFMAKFQDYRGHIRSINRWNLNARYFDRYFLNGLNQQDWEEAIADVQTKLTNQVIADAVKQMPAAIYRLGGTEVIQKLVARRDILKPQALKYYRFLSQTVTVNTSEKREHFDITNQPDGKLSVKVNKVKKDGIVQQVVYYRTFDPRITGEVRLYGMGGPDVFAVHGNEHSTITLRMIGGDTKDKFAIDSDITGKGNRYIYDIPGQKYQLPAQARLHITPDTSLTNFHRLNYKYDFLQPLFLASYSKDYGFQLIGDFIYQKQGFGKDPYAFRQSLMVNYGFGTNSLLINYTGDFKKAIGNNDLVVNVLSKGPNYKSNFFGIGNNTTFVNKGDDAVEYYRNLYNYMAADVRLKHTYGNWTALAGIAGQYYNGDAEDNQNKLLNVYNDQHPNENVFKPEGLLGLYGTAALDTRDKGTMPHKGIYWSTSITGMQGLNSNAHNYGQIQSEFSFYINPDKDSSLVIANRIGGGTTLGNAAYFQQLKLGGSQNLRGFYNWRFTGKSMAFDNFEVRVKLFDFASYLLPGTLGVIGFNDVGRVWSPGEKSDAWHDGYGGGVYFLPAQLILIQGVVGFSKEGTYPYISAGFRF